MYSGTGTVLTLLPTPSPVPPRLCLKLLSRMVVSGGGGCVWVCVCIRMMGEAERSPSVCVCIRMMGEAERSPIIK